jgi:hypothetical protein
MILAPAPGETIIAAGKYEFVVKSNGEDLGETNFEVIA